MQLLLLDVRCPDYLPVSAVASMTAPLRFSPHLAAKLQQKFLALPLKTGEGTYITTEEKEADTWSGEVLRVRPPQDPVSQAVEVMHQARRRGEFERSMTHRLLLPYLWSEAQEFADQVDAWEVDHNEQALKAELGDLLLQVLFHSELAAERGAFTFGDVAQSFLDKLRSRAPYLFDGSSGIIDEVTQDRLWQAGKRRELKNGYTSPL